MCKPSLWLVAGAFVVLFAHGCGGGPGSAPSPIPSAPSPAAPAGSEVVRTATFESANGYTTMGRAAIVRTGSSYALELQDDFRTSTGGVLDVRLCRTSACTEGDLTLGDIQARSGRQRYPLPDSADAYRYVVIFCRAVRAPFGFGLLQ